MWYKKWGGAPTKKSYLEDLTTSMQLFQVNMQSEFFSAVKKTHDDFPPEFHGGPLLFAIAIRSIQYTSEKSMTNLVDAVKLVRISKVPGEDVTVAIAKLRSAVTLLTSASQVKPGGGMYLLP